VAPVDRIDVEEGERVVGLENLRLRDRAFNDFAEEAGRVVGWLAHVFTSG
jgi:hypothetical protein